MKEMIGYTDPFMSPVTGELASFRQIPQADYGDILIADMDGYFQPSLDLIDAKIDINYLKKITEGMMETRVILSTESPFFPDSQYLSAMPDGYLMKFGNGLLTTTASIPPEDLYLPSGQLFIGDDNNLASPSQTITIDNLPNLGVATIGGLPSPAGKIWRGTSDNRPEESDAVSLIEADIIAINARFLLGNFVMGDALIQYTFPNAQFLINLQDGILKKTGKILQTAVEGTDYLKELPNLTNNMVWRGDATNRPEEADYISADELQELVDEAEGYKDEAETAAEEASAVLEEVNAVLVEVNAVAVEVITSAIAAGASAAGAAASAIAASNYLNTLLTTGITLTGAISGTGPLNAPITTTFNNTLNQISNAGDINIGNYFLNNVKDPISLQDAATKKYVDTKSSASSITLTGDISGTGLLSSPITTTFNKTLNQIMNAGDIDIGNFYLKNVKTASLSTDGANKGYVDNHTWTSSQITDFSPAVTAFRLDEFAVPNYSVNFNDQYIYNVKDPNSPYDAATKNYVDNHTWTSSQITDFSTAVAAFRLDQFAIPTTSLNVNSQKIINVANPVLNTDAANKGWVNSQISSSTPTITLTGDVTGTGAAGTSITTTFTKTLNQITNAGDVNMQNHWLYNLKDPNSPQDGATKNYIDNKTWTSSQITDFSTAVTAFRLDQLAAPASSLNLNSQYLSSVKDPSLAQDAATKNYVDSKVSSPFVSGTFTPTLTDGSAHDVIGNSTYGGKGYAVQIGKYYKIGKLVFITMNITFGGTAYGSSDTTALYFYGLPYTPDFSTSEYLMVPIYYNYCGANNIISLFIKMTSASSYAPINCIYQSTNVSASNPSVFLTRGQINLYTTTTFSMNFCYTTAS